MTEEEELKEAKENIKFAISKGKLDNSSHKSKLAKDFTEAFLTGAREAYRIAEAKTKTKNKS